MKKKLLLAAACVLLVGSLGYGITIVSVAGSNGSQALGGVLVQSTLNNLYTDLASVSTVLGGATGAPTGTGAVVLGTGPTITAPVGIVVDCATTAACPSTARALHMVQGIGTLSSGTPSTYAVTTISPAFTGAITYLCQAQDATTVANNIGVLTAGYVSGSAVTFTGPNTNTDTFRFSCIGY